MNSMTGWTRTTHETTPKRVPVKTCDCGHDLLAICKWIRPVIEDAENYINFMTEKIRTDGGPRLCQEARKVLMGNLREARSRLDAAVHTVSYRREA